MKEVDVSDNPKLLGLQLGKGIQRTGKEGLSNQIPEKNYIQLMVKWRKETVSRLLSKSEVAYYRELLFGWKDNCVHIFDKQTD